MVTTGVLGQRWRASVTPWGAVEPWSGDRRPFDWHVAAADRWHSPAREPSVRQRRIDGTAVVETRIRVPDGDVVHTVWSVADTGGLTLVEVRNESPSPIVVAFTRGDLLSVRPPSTSIEGIELPSDSVAFPVGHRASVTVAIAHPPRRGDLPSSLPTPIGVARGWTARVERASRFVVPGSDLAEEVAALRCEVALAGPALPEDDPVGFLLGVGQLVRMGEPARDRTDEVGAAAERVLRDASRRGEVEWSAAAALDAAGTALAAAEEHRALGDLRRAMAALGPREPLPSEPPDEAARRIEHVERRFVSGSELFPLGLPGDWLGVGVECYSVSTGPASSVSCAVRWHGARPALLWEQSGEPVRLTSPVLAPQWSSSLPAGEALWPEPPEALR